MSLYIRPANLADAQRIAEIRTKAFVNDPLDEYVDFKDIDEFCARWSEAQVNGSFQTTVAILDDQVVGFMQWQLYPQTIPNNDEVKKKDNDRSKTETSDSESQRRLNLVKDAVSSAVTENMKEIHKYLYITWLGTDPAHQGAGVGTKLLSEVNESAKREHCIAYLESSRVGKPFYLKRGWKLLPEKQHVFLHDPQGKVGSVVIPVLILDTHV